MTPGDVARHAEMLANRVRKTHRKLHKAFARDGVEAYRLYDRDIPEVRAVVDRYGDHLVVAEYEREQTADVPDYPDALARAAGDALGIPASNRHVKRRRTGRARGYGREKAAPRIVVRERALRFGVELEGQLDTGLFADHRDTRRLVGERARGKTVLNLFAYTGTFTCWAAHGGARATVSVDATKRYVAWARDNLALNGLAGSEHELVAADVDAFLERDRRRFDLVIVDPPSRSSRYGAGDLDVQRDHPALLARLVDHVEEGGAILFSTNHQRFEPRLEGLPVRAIEEITERTVPVDYRNRTVHRAFWLDR